MWAEFGVPATQEATAKGLGQEKEKSTKQTG
jgi:hypothetical protein